jgi:hypothetical protein
MDPSLPDRRQFTAAVAALAATQLVPLTPVQAADPQPLTAVAESLFEALRVRHGEHITEAQMNSVKRSVFRRVLRAEALRELRLTNGIGPAVTFRADLP